MHVHFMIRGIKQDVETWFKYLETSWFWLPFKDENGVEKKQQIQGQLRYSLFGTWEFIFPKEYQDAVLTTFGFHNNLRGNKKYQFQMNLIRLALGLKKAPKDFNTNQKLTLPNELWVEVVPIGIKHDAEQTFENGWTHEAL